MFTQPSGASLYEGRTRGKRIRYNFSDADDDKDSEFDADTRSGRSTRNTPLLDVPRFTASGRQIRKPQTGLYGEVKINGSRGTSAGSESGSLKRGGSEAPFSYAEDQWDGDSQGDDEDDLNGDDEDEDAEIDSESDSESEWDDTAFLQQGDEKKSLRIILKVNSKARLSRANSMAREAGSHGRVTRASSAAKDAAELGRLSRANSRESPRRALRENGTANDLANGNKRRRLSNPDISMKDVETLANGHGPPVSSVVAGQTA